MPRVVQTHSAIQLTLQPPKLCVQKVQDVSLPVASLTPVLVASSAPAVFSAPSPAPVQQVSPTSTECQLKEA